MIVPSTFRNWHDTSLSHSERAELLALAMTPAEQAGQLVNASGSLSTEWLVANHVGSFYFTKGARLAELARELRARHRLHVPPLFALDCVHGHALADDLGGTIFPVPLAIAATFDPDRARRIGSITASEMIATGIRWTYGPNIDVVRDPRFGRVEETFGEDPFLVGEMGAAMVEGLQGSWENPHVLACAKHFTGYSAGEGARDSSECPVSWRVLRRDHLPPYRRLVRAGVRTVMSGYHAIDGTPCVINGRLLNEELRVQLGFRGFVVSDADNVQWCTLLHGLAGTHAQFIVRALEAGNEVFLGTEGVVEALSQAVLTRRLDPSILREAAEQMLEAKFALGLFDEPETIPEVQVRTPESFCSAVDVATASMVLLENRGVLPLSPDLRRIALVGRLAKDLRQQFGCWSLLCRNDSADSEIAKQAEAQSWTYLANLKARASLAKAELNYVPGCGPVPGTEASQDEVDITATVEAAKLSDVIIAIVGDSDHWAGEGRDRADLSLPGKQQELLEALHATGKPLVVVLAVTKPLALPWIKANAAAVVCAWNSGMGGGEAMASLLWGDRDFIGRTPVTWPAHVGQVPINYDRVPGAHFEGFGGGPGSPVPTAPREASCDLNIWRQENARHIDLPAEWVHGLWPFGHGLSYAAIHITAAKMERSRWQIGEAPRIFVTLANHGEREGLAIVQVYVRDVEASVTRPDRRLAAWSRVMVPAKGSAKAQLQIAPEILEVVDANGNYVTEPGAFQALVGFSSLVTELKVIPFVVG